jgi:BMFP domain-containing protein YqiC
MLVFRRRLRYQPRMANESIDKLARTLAESVPGAMRSVRDDLEQNFRGILKGAVDRLDLVTREEFDVQQAVLARTREKLEALEHRLADLETAKLATQQRAKKKVTGKVAKKKAAKKTARKKVTKKKASKKTARKKVTKKQ